MPPTKTHRVGKAIVGRRADPGLQAALLALPTLPSTQRRYDKEKVEGQVGLTQRAQDLMPSTGVAGEDKCIWLLPS